ncbi:MAG TPA: NAD(P)-dependent oxidoreductase [Bacteroidales bacterium]|nr:NAD(P)-dependent oxidoreductase [Bacteroidales bacterium]HCI58407.1 3-beta hydroxysteroid dehydrogenase [Bacteroidota bacterium]HOU96936.1 NAD(P)-dependent oxidoreductase [Bacteroidales bacterium]HRC92515.1 NAD(P)-dependent oxidoreductase [Bacteroidia bacterium]
MKNVALIGASGFVGTAILNELLNRGHKVTAIVRHPEKIMVKHPNLTVVKADVSDVKSMVNICTGKDAIISAYNPGWDNPNIYEETLKNYPLILEAAKRAGVKRILIVGGAGTLFCAPGVRLMDAGTLPEEFMGGVKSLAEFYINTLCNEKEIDWVFFSPAAVLEHGKRTGKFRLGKDDLIVDENGISHISVEDYAVAMVDELEQAKHHQERFTIGY